MLGPVIEAVVASRDPAAAAEFHRRAFGLVVLESRADGVRVGVRGTRAGFVRFVACPQDTSPPVPPEIWATGPRLLGIYSRDLDRTRRNVEEAGGTVGPLVTYQYGEFMRECVVSAPDHLYWTVPQVRPRRPSPALDADPGRLHGELHSAVINVVDLSGALDFFVGGGGLQLLYDGTMSGAAVEEMIGLPRGASLRLAFLSAADQAPARLELMQFSGLPVRDCTNDPLGLRRLVFHVSDAARVCDRLCDHGGTRLGPALVRGPAGVEIEVVQVLQ